MNPRAFAPRGVRWLAVSLASVCLAGTAAASASATSPSGDPVVYAAGDIACATNNATPTTCQQAATASLISSDANAVLPLGDDQYPCGGYTAFLQFYDPTWGLDKAITFPVPGNHEYTTSGKGCDATGTATGYFDYYDGVGNSTGPAGTRGQGWYSFTVGAWHLIALNGNCSRVGGCGATSPQGTWLANDLKTDTAACTLAYWHQPRWSSVLGDNGSYQYFWKTLYSAQADLVLNGHAHAYERFSPLAGSPDSNGRPVPKAGGMVEVVAGTGGDDHQVFGSIQPGSAARDDSDFGVLRLVLHPTSYDWSFLPIPGSSGFTDSGTASCR